MDIRQILDTLPHRYPFLLVDRVLSITPGQSIVALKNVTMNEEFFNGHFPHYQVMPGVLIIEALAQAAGILSFKTMGNAADKESVYFLLESITLALSGRWSQATPSISTSPLSVTHGGFGNTRHGPS